MIYENEITVKVLCNYDELTDILTNQGFKITNETVLDDIYMIDNKIDIINDDFEKILSNYIIVRNSDMTWPIINYKYKTFKEDGNYDKQGKACLKVEDVDKAVSLFKLLNYNETIHLHNNIKFYKKDNIELVAAEVNDEYICIEYAENEKIPYDELIEKFEKFNIPYDKSNYYLSKAKIELEKLRKNWIYNWCRTYFYYFNKL